MNDKNVILQVRGLQKNFGELEVLKGLDLDIHEGEVISIIGPSGGGKSTFLRCLNLLETPDSGQVLFKGQDVTDKKLNIAKYRQSIGMVFQHFNVFPNMTVLENVTLAPVLEKKVPKEQAREEAMALLRRVGLGDKADEYPRKLSGGQKQRCACARAIINQPKLILADEPTGALDSHSSQMLLSTIQSINEDLGATILMVTHDAFSASYANRILFMRDGAIFTEIRKGGDSRRTFFEKILDVLTMMGGGTSDVR